MEHFITLIFTQTTWVQWLLLGLLASVFVAQIVIYAHYYTGILRHAKTDAHPDNTRTDTQPPVSVVVCARNESANLEQFLPLVLEQEYPDYEVIVVNDGSSDDTEMLVAQLQQKYPHLRYTYTPDHTDVISRKKLALTIGIKAAHNDILLFTDADCRPISCHWISEIARQFTPDTDFVLGYGGYHTGNTLLGRLIAYDTLFIAMQYLGFAFRGHPYMGVGRNLAYRRTQFFAHRGFAGSLHLASGDDDLFINKFATGTNTHIATTAASITQSLPQTTFAAWYHQKERHLTTAPLYTPQSKRIVTVEPATRGLFYLLFVATLCLWNPLTSGAAIALYLARYITQTVIINKTATRLGERHFYASILVFDILLPLITLFLLIFGRKKNIHWK
ncbi:MAG: glycosyltransferase [Paludibacteraceae bacterium]